MQLGLSAQKCQKYQDSERHKIPWLTKHFENSAAHDRKLTTNCRGGSSDWLDLSSRQRVGAVPRLHHKHLGHNLQNGTDPVRLCVCATDTGLGITSEKPSSNAVCPTPNTPGMLSRLSGDLRSKRNRTGVEPEECHLRSCQTNPPPG